MAKKIKDTDYLVISARVKAMEAGLMTRQRMDQILEARSDEEVKKILQECGYPDLDASDPEAMDAELKAAREDLINDLGDGAPDPRYIEIFKLKYDYHNAKAILKARAMGVSPDRMLMDIGRVPAADLKAAIESGDLDSLPEMLAESVAESAEVLSTTKDPQLSDIVLDKWLTREMTVLARETGSEFLQGFVRTSIDSQNLKILVRTLRMKKGPEFLQGALFEDGEIPIESLVEISINRGRGLSELYAPTRFHAAAEAGEAALSGGPLTEFEKLCADAVSDYLAGAQYVPFGEAPLIGYLAARDNERTNLRILLMGRSSGLDPDVIRSRLRVSFV